MAKHRALFYYRHDSLTPDKAPEVLVGYHDG